MAPKPLSDYEVFIAWELEACRAIEKRFNKRTAAQEAETAWHLKNRQRQYVGAVKAIQSSLKLTKAADKKIPKASSKFSKHRAGQSNAHWVLWETLVTARVGWVVARASLLILDSEQGERDDHGNVIRTGSLSLRGILRSVVKVERRKGRRAVRRQSEYLEPENEEEEIQEIVEEDKVPNADCNTTPREKLGITLNLRRRVGISEKGIEENGTHGMETLRNPRLSLKPPSPRKREREEANDLVTPENRINVAEEDRRSSKRRHNIFGLREASGEDGQAREVVNSAVGPTEAKVVAGVFGGLYNMIEPSAVGGRDFASFPDLSYTRAREEFLANLARRPTFQHQIEPDSSGVAIQDFETMEEYNEARRKAYHRKAAIQLGFKGPEGQVPVEGDFVFQGNLGSGGFGVVDLWILRDENEKIVDRVAVKDNHFHCDDWATDLDHFYRDVEDLKPREAVMHDLASGPEKDSDTSCIVRYRGSVVFTTKKIIRIYMEFCPVGGFSSVRWVNRDGYKKDRMLLYRSIPALWALFECCAKAIHIMTFGCLPGGEKPRGWKAMVHRDLNTWNVFMSLPHDTKWKDTPTMKLGDFGLAGHISEEYIQKFSGRYQEQEIANPQIRPQHVSVSEKADVFSLGQIMIKSLNPDHDLPYDSYTFEMDGSEFPKINKRLLKCYPKALVELAYACVHREPDDRPRVEELCRRIEEEVADLWEMDVSEQAGARFSWDSRYKEMMVSLELPIDL